MTTSPPGEVLRHQSHLLERLQGGSSSLLLTTDPGLEDVVAAEAAQYLPDIAGGLYERRPRGFHGHLLILPPRLEAATREHALQLRSIHHVIEPRYAFQIDAADPLEQIRSTLRSRDLGDNALSDGSFRVTTKRHGEHAFTSTDVQRYAGAGLIERYARPVELVDFDTQVRVDVRDDQCIVGIQWTRERLTKRSWRRYHPRAALRANVAYALWRFAGLTHGRVLDPFCGSGTIPIEGAGYSPHLEIVASDYSTSAIAGAADNIEAAGVQERITLTHTALADLTQLHAAASFDAIVTNPPYGIRSGHGMNFYVFYRILLHTAAALLKPGGRLVFLAWKRGIVNRANQEKSYFRPLHARVIETGGIYPRLYVMERQ